MRVREGNKEKDIIEASIKVFAKEGFHQAKISTIAKVAGVATGSVYLYFKNKESILNKIFEELWQKIYTEASSLSKRKDMGPLEKFETLIDYVFDLFISNPSLAVVFVSEEHHLVRNRKSVIPNFYEKFLDEGEAIINEGIKSGVFISNINVKVFRNFTFGGIRHLLHQWAQFPIEFPLNTVRQNVKYILKKGILLN
jgi:TetR/AcrR family transcriptional regulator, fatty acid metabolism regulator protein